MQAHFLENISNYSPRHNQLGFDVVLEEVGCAGLGAIETE